MKIQSFIDSIKKDNIYSYIHPYIHIYFIDLVKLFDSRMLSTDPKALYEFKGFK